MPVLDQPELSGSLRGWTSLPWRLWFLPCCRRPLVCGAGLVCPWEVSSSAPGRALKPAAPPKGDFTSLCPRFIKDELGRVLLAHATTGGHEDVRAAEVSLCFWGSGVDRPAPSLCAFSEGSFQTGSLMHEHPKRVAVPRSPLGPPGFLFQGNICSTLLRGRVSPSPPEPPRGTCSKWRCPREGFPLAGNPQRYKHLQGGLRSEGGSWPGALIAGCGRTAALGRGAACHRGHVRAVSGSV